MKKGDFVKIKDGVKDSNFEKFAIAGWQGTVVDAYTFEGEKLVSIDWDIETIKKLPVEFIELSLEQHRLFSAMILKEEDVLPTQEIKKDNPRERENLISRLEDRYTSAGFDEQDQRIANILESRDISVTKELLEKYRAFLISNLEQPVFLTGIELFSWEEGFALGYGSKREYKQARKTNPSYKDNFSLLEILELEDYFEGDLFIKVKRKSDKKVFEIPLSELEAVDENSKNYQLLNDFSVWIVNYR